MAKNGNLLAGTIETISKLAIAIGVVAIAIELVNRSNNLGSADNNGLLVWALVICGGLAGLVLGGMARRVRV